MTWLGRTDERDDLAVEDAERLGEQDHGTFDGFHHVDDWIPQRLVTATGPNPLPR